MKYRLKHHPNQNWVSVCTNSRVTDEMIVEFSADNIVGQPGDAKIPEFVKNIFAIAGIEKVTLYPHSIDCTKGEMFSWDDMLPVIIFAINSEFDPSGRAVEMPP